MLTYLSKNGKNLFAMAIAGSALGWLIGMSVTPVIRDVIIAVLAVIVGIMGLVSGTKNEEATEKSITNFRDYFLQVDLLPIGVCMFFLTLGSGFGIYTRTHEWLGLEPKEMVSRWNYAIELSANHPPNASDSLKSRMLKQLFEAHIGKEQEKQKEKSVINNIIDPSEPVLVNAEVSAEFCNRIRNKKGQELENAILEELRTQPDGACLVDQLKALMSEGKDKEHSVKLLKLLLCPDCQ